MTSKGTSTLEVQTNDTSLAETYMICLDFIQTGVLNTDGIAGNGVGKNY